MKRVDNSSIIGAAATGRNYRRGFRKGLRATEQLGFVLYDLCENGGGSLSVTIGVPESAELSTRRNTVVYTGEISN